MMTEEKKDDNSINVEVDSSVKPRPRPTVMRGTTQKLETGYGSLYVTLNEDDKGLFEVFAQIGRGGGYSASFTEALARVISLSLQSGVPAEEIIKQLEGIRSPKVAWDHGDVVHSVPDAIAKALKRREDGKLDQFTGAQLRLDSYDKAKKEGDTNEQGSLNPLEETPPADTNIATDVESEKESVSKSEGDGTRDLIKYGLAPECPMCNTDSLYFAEGCVSCRVCGYSECS